MRSLALELFPVLMNRKKLRLSFAGALPHRQTGPTEPVLGPTKGRTRGAGSALASAAGFLLVATAAAAQDVKHGQTVFAANCAICHSTAPGRNVIGPTLHAVVGRKAGTVPGFNYSPAMQSSGVVWTPANLDAWLTSPREFVPRSRMSFAGLHASSDRADVIAWLAQQK